MSILICPVCASDLVKQDNTLKCCENHCFDIARQGYVNLLRNNSTSKKHHGDDKLMVNARRDFFDKGYYSPLRDAVIQTVIKHAKANAVIIDSGCGDCWYTAGIYSALDSAKLSPHITGIDISKDALIAGSRRCRSLELCVASAAHLPLKSGCADILLNIFSPLEAEEYSRVLSHDGFLIRAIPMERHLWSLKQAVYDTPYVNPPADTNVTGFILTDSVEVHERIAITSNEDIQNLFKMTPYYYKTGERDQQKLADLNYLETELEVIVAAYRKK